MKCLNFIALVLVLVGAINWGLWGFFQFDLVAWLANGNTSWAARFVYAIVGLAGVWSLGLLGKCKSLCSCSKGCGCGCSSESKSCGCKGGTHTCGKEGKNGGSGCCGK